MIDYVNGNKVILLKNVIHLRTTSVKCFFELFKIYKSSEYRQRGMFELLNK